MSYQLRERDWKNYKELADLKLPRAERAAKQVQDDHLYELEVIEEDEYSGRVKVHYIGYGPEHDEWRDKKDVVVLKPKGKQVLILRRAGLAAAWITVPCSFDEWAY